MTQGIRLRLFMFFTLAAAVIGVSIIWFAYQRVSILQSLQQQADVTVKSIYRLSSETYSLLYTADDIYEAHQSWERAFNEAYEELDIVSIHRGLQILSPEVAQSVRQTRNLWNITSNGFVSGGSALGTFLSSGISSGSFTNIYATIEIVSSGIASGEIDAAYSSELFRLRQVYLEIDSANEQLWSFTTVAIEQLGNDIQAAARRLTTITILVSALLFVTLIALIFIVLVQSLRVFRSSNINLEERVEERTRSIQGLLDFSGEGFLSFGDDLIVRPEISRECEAIFGRSIVGERISDALYPDAEKRQDFADAMDLVFSESSSPGVVFDLIDSRVYLGERTIDLSFQAIDRGTIMCQLQDITEREELREKIETENERREVILRAVTSKRYFLGIIDEADRLFQTIESTVVDGMYSGNKGETERLIRDLHTFKANAAFLRMRRATNAAHELETALIEYSVLENPEPLESIISTLRSEFDSEVSCITDELGEHWIKDTGTIEVNSNTLRTLYDYVLETYPNDTRLGNALDKISRVPLSGLFKRVEDLVDQLSSSHGKKVSFRVTEEDIAITPDMYHRISDALSHIIRNMVIHGIEFPRHREKAGKPSEGTIEINAYKQNGSIYIKVGDDGAGISIEKIKARAQERGMISGDDELQPKDIIRLVFEPGFSTADIVTPVSGRGYGLPSVRNTIYGLGGKISVSTKRGRGTEFTIILPDHVKETLSA